jgi:hypothetical protein
MKFEKLWIYDIRSKDTASAQEAGESKHTERRDGN